MSNYEPFILKLFSVNRVTFKKWSRKSLSDCREMKKRIPCTFRRWRSSFWKGICTDCVDGAVNDCIMECQIHVDEMFCALSISDTMFPVMSILLEKFFFVILLLQSSRTVILSMTKSSSWENHHSYFEKTCKNLGFETHQAVVYGLIS